MTMTPGMIVRHDAVLQHHAGKCSRCAELTNGILVGNFYEKRWYVAERLTAELWQIHVHQVGQ